MIKRWLFLLLLPLSLLQAHYFNDNLPSGFKANIDISSEQLDLHDLVMIDVHFSYPERFEIIVPNLRDSLRSDEFVKDFSLISEHVSALDIHDGIVSQTISYQLEVWEEGPLFFPLPILRFIQHKENTSIPVEIFPNLLTIDVRAPDNKENKAVIAPLLAFSKHAPIEMNYSNRQNLMEGENVENESLRNQELLQNRVFPWKKLLFCLAVTALLILTFTQLKKWRNKTIPTPQIIDPYQKALDALNLLQSEKLPEKGLFDNFYVRVTDIVRQYIEDAYQIKAPERTTQEFLNEVMQVSCFQEQTKNHLADFLKFADLVKFAKFHPAVKDCNKTIQAAQNFLKGST